MPVKQTLLPRRILDLIRSRASSMSLRQRRIADYILGNPEAFYFQSAQELAANAGVSHATVVRFSQVLGYKGFSEFIHDAQKVMRTELTIASKFSPNLIDEENGGKTTSMLKRLLRIEFESLDALAKNISDEDIRACVDMMEVAESIYILARMSSYPIAMLFYDTLMKACTKCYLVPEHTLQSAAILKQLDQRSLLFSIAYTRYSVETVTFTEMAAQTGCKIVSITNSLVSPLVPLSDLKFIVPTTSISFADLFAAHTVLVSAISLEYGRRSGARTEKSLDLFNKIMLQGNYVHP